MSPRVVAPLRHAPEQAVEAAARRDLRGQIAALERQLGEVLVSAFPRAGIGAGDGAALALAGPRVLGLGELEAVRDELSVRLTAARHALAARTEREERARVRLERMLLDPGRHRFARVASAELGERGCGVWEVRPRLGLIGMLAGWWHVKLSSGCPLPG